MAGLTDSIKRGSGELAVLAVLEAQPLHGYEIARRIERDTEGVLRFTLASLYPLLYRMEKQGWAKAEWETTDSGVRRRAICLTASGLRQLEATRLEWTSFFRAIDQLAGFTAVRNWSALVRHRLPAMGVPADREADILRRDRPSPRGCLRAGLAAGPTG